MNAFNPKLDDCGCCEAVFDFPTLTNRPGLPTLSYRLGTHSTFLKWLLERLARQSIPDGANQGTRPLLALTSRSADDPAIALLDAWSVVADVLTFYQERIANEGFLRTATERRSVLELARAIGYELSPGVAASTVLAFTVEDAVGAPGQAQVPKGTKVQSFPVQGKLPQTFETAEAIATQAAWNALRPRLTQPAPITSTSNLLYLKGVSASVKAGDLMLLVINGSPTVKRVVKATADVVGDRIRLEFAPNAATPPFEPPTFVPTDFAAVSLDPVPFAQAQIQTQILQKTWRDSDLATFLTLNRWDQAELLKQIATLKSTVPKVQTVQLFVFRTTVSCFGHNAPKWSSLPKLGVKNQRGTDPYPISWDGTGEPTIAQNSQSKPYPVGSGSDTRVYLERSVPEALAGGWAIFEAPGIAPRPVEIDAVSEASLADFGFSGKATGLDLTTTDKLASFKVRYTAVSVQSEELPLLFDPLALQDNSLPVGTTATQVPIETDLAMGTSRLVLDQMALGLRVGQVVVLTGDRTDNPGIRGSEVLTVKAVTHSRGYTILEFTLGTQHRYLGSSVTLNANAVRATHGETGYEILGGGDGAIAHQQFTLKKPPLTYTSAANASGSQSTLEIRVNQILWSETPSLYGLGQRDEKYTVRLDNESNPTVIFGDGIQGARLPSGTENLVATYRTGIGLDGQVEAGSLSLLQTRPQGIREVTNPLPATGAASPETLDNARTNAPLKVRTLERIVSLTDFEDFAQAFAGIGKAQAIALFTGERRLVHLTIAAANGDPVDPTSDLYRNLIDAINQARDPVHPVQVASYKPLYFKLVTRVQVDTRSLKPLVFSAVEAALKTAFSFPQRAFGQVVTAAEVMTTIQQVAGVVAVDLDALYLPPAIGGLNQVLGVAIAHWDAAQQIIAPAELLLINPVGITLLEMQP
ncbi:MAG: putative baseplate assembly protein [Thermosynechococcaceae cyanobacterium]